MQPAPNPVPAHALSKLPAPKQPEITVHHLVAQVQSLVGSRPPKQTPTCPPTSALFIAGCRHGGMAGRWEQYMVVPPQPQQHIEAEKEKSRVPEDGEMVLFFLPPNVMSVTLGAMSRQGESPRPLFFPHHHQTATCLQSLPSLFPECGHQSHRPPACPHKNVSNEKAGR